ncbi:MAG: hypothetical protein QOG62_2822 [Thermoleophilaceae bacterium]|nr:hypothetical protein [Thermoleophilaceae bacterium]
MSESDHETELAPIPQTRAAFDWLAHYGNHEVEESVTQMAQRVREIAPDCVAMSLTLAQGALTFTVMTDRPGVALLDAMQYLDGGPCETAVEQLETVAIGRPPTDEGRWQMFAAAEAMTGISSTLSLPVLRGHTAVGGVNLYASTNDAFDGHHEEIADACGAWAEGAITNADLSFTSRVRAAAAPERLRDRGDVNVAMGYVAAYQDIELAEAAARIRGAAARAGVAEADFARFLLDAHSSRHPS